MIVKAQVWLKNKVVKNIFWLSFDKMFRILIGLVAGIWVAKYLGPVDFGKINYVSAFIGIIVTISTLGLDSFLVKEIIERPAEKNILMGTAFVLRVIAVFAAITLSLGVFYLMGLKDDYFKIYLILLLTVIVTPFDIIDIEYQSLLKSRKTVIAKNIAYALGAAVKVFFIFFKAPLIIFIWVMAIETALAYLILILFYQQSAKISEWFFDKRYIKELLYKGWPFILSGISVILYMRIDQIMLGSLLGNKSVGVFSAATRITEIFHFIPLAISSSFYTPLMKALGEDNIIEYKKKLSLLFNYSFAFSFCIAFGGTFFAKYIIELLFGASYDGAALVLQIHIWSLVAVFMGVAATPHMVISGLQKISLYKTILGLVSNLILNIFLIPRFLVMGAAIATLVSYFISAVFSNLLFKSTREIFKYQFLSIKNFILFKKSFFSI